MNFNNKIKFLVVLLLFTPFVLLTEFIHLTKNLGFKFTPYTFLFISILYFIFVVMYATRLFK